MLWRVPSKLIGRASLYRNLGRRAAGICGRVPGPAVFCPVFRALSCALLTDSDKIEKLNTHTIPGLPTPTHVAWHPSGRYMAFAVNRSARQDARETASRIVIYDVVKHELFTSPQLFSDSSSVTYPAFSPDGETLYFCATSLMAHTRADSAKYHLCALAFNIHGGRRFGRKADTLYHSRPAPPPPPGAAGHGASEGATWGIMDR